MTPLQKQMREAAQKAQVRYMEQHDPEDFADAAYAVVEPLLLDLAVKFAHLAFDLGAHPEHFSEYVRAQEALKGVRG